MRASGASQYLPFPPADLEHHVYSVGNTTRLTGIHFPFFFAPCFDAYIPLMDIGNDDFAHAIPAYHVPFLPFRILVNQKHVIILVVVPNRNQVVTFERQVTTATGTAQTEQNKKYRK